MKFLTQFAREEKEKSNTHVALFAINSCLQAKESTSLTKEEGRLLHSCRDITGSRD